MRDDQVVARELEQAEARLVEARSLVTSITLATQYWTLEEFFAARDGLVAAAIEVGRLRALAPGGDPPQWSAEQIVFLNEHMREQLCNIGAFIDQMLGDITVPTHALAAREEVQG